MWGMDGDLGIGRIACPAMKRYGLTLCEQGIRHNLERATKMTLNDYLMVAGLLLGVVLLFFYTSWEQRRDLSKLCDAVEGQLKNEGWVIEPEGKSLSKTPFLATLPREMKTGMLQRPFFFNQTDKAWIFANRMVMHRRVSVFGNRVVVVLKVPWNLPCGVRIQENVNFGVLDKPSDSRFGFFDQVDSDRSWWVCSMKDSVEADCLLMDILQVGIPYEIQCLQIVDGYMITSSRSVIAKEENYFKSLESTQVLYENITRLFGAPHG